MKAFALILPVLLLSACVTPQQYHLAGQDILNNTGKTIGGGI